MWWCWMKMFLTRLGASSRCIVTGDISQIDLPKGRKSGLMEAMEVLRGVEGISIVELTARDVVASAQYILDRANDENVSDPGFYSNLKYFVSSISAKDESTVIVKTSKRACYGLLYEMTFPIVPASQVDADSPLGTGPYQINTFAAGDYAWLQANPNWWKAQQNHFQRLFRPGHRHQSPLLSRHLDL